MKKHKLIPAALIAAVALTSLTACAPSQSPEMAKCLSVHEKSGETKSNAQYLCSYEAKHGGYNTWMSVYGPNPTRFPAEPKNWKP